MILSIFRNKTAFSSSNSCFKPVEIISDDNIIPINNVNLAYHNLGNAPISIQGTEGSTNSENRQIPLYSPIPLMNLDEPADSTKISEMQLSEYASSILANRDLSNISKANYAFQQQQLIGLLSQLDNSILIDLLSRYYSDTNNTKKCFDMNKENPTIISNKNDMKNKYIDNGEIKKNSFLQKKKDKFQDDKQVNDLNEDIEETININQLLTDKTDSKSIKRGNPINKLISLANRTADGNDKLILDKIIEKLNAETPNNTKFYFQTKKTESEKPRKNCCSCKFSHCLKLYCECFKINEYCTNCTCDSCFNRLKFNAIRQKSIEHLKLKSKYAFQNVTVSKDEGKKHIKGCRCKNSGCKKNYCECYQNKIGCSDLCKCRNCENCSH